MREYKILNKHYKLNQKKNLVQKKKKRTNKDGMIFSVSGVHGVGKTTLYDILYNSFMGNSNINFYPERLRANPPVPFGSKDKNIAFRSEIHYNQQMIQRDQLVKKFIKNRRENIAILDRSPLSTIVYARALSLPKIDYELIYDTFQSVNWAAEYIIYLEANPKTIMQRIYQRGSLDEERQKWNEDDFNYLKRVLKKYEDIFQEYKLEQNNKLFRISTEKKNVQEVSKEIIELIELKTGIQTGKKIHIPINQAKLTHWI